MLKTPKGPANQRAVVSPARPTNDPVVAHGTDENEAVTPSVLGCVLPKAPSVRQSVKKD